MVSFRDLALTRDWVRHVFYRRGDCFFLLSSLGFPGIVTHSQRNNRICVLVRLDILVRDVEKDVVVPVVEGIASVSHTHLTLPTIYSV